MKNRLFSRNPATGRRRAVPDPVPSAPHAATVPDLTPTDLYAGGYRYDPDTISGLYADADRLTQGAENAEKQANRLLGDAARYRVWAADRIRIARLAELDAVTPPDAAWPVPAPQVPAQPPALEHFHNGIGAYAPCGDASPFQTADPSLVTCPQCQAHLAGLVQRSPGAEPRAAWAPVRTGVDGWGDPQPDLPDTLTMPRVRATGGAR